MPITMNHYRKNSSLSLSLGRGFSLIEVLVTIVILLIGLLGLAGLQVRAFSVQMESYQRSQALTLLKDMANRIQSNGGTNNGTNAAAYITATPLGTGGTNPVSGGTCSAGTSIAAIDLCEWHNALLGAAETMGGTTNVGAMIGARGCVYQVAAPLTNVATPYLIVVSWQGINNTANPDVTTSTSAGQCGFNQYLNKSNAPDESLHRVVSLPVSMAYLK
jgi:type IV pilus assembly protein PilV